MGVTPKDQEILKFLHRKKKRIFLIINKIDLIRHKINFEEIHIGCEKKFLISCKSYDGLNEIEKEIGSLGTIVQKEKPMIGIIGRCNSGKSTLLNAIVGYDRVKVSEIYGQTRDSISEEGRDFVFMDTAGYRDEKDYLEFITSVRRHKSLIECDGILLLLDGGEGLTKIEKSLVEEGIRYGKFLVVAINKREKIENYQPFEYLNVPSWVPICTISAIKNDIKDIFYLLKKSYYDAKKVFKTHDLNNWFKTKEFGLRSVKGPLSIKYICQQKSSPLTFMYSATLPMDKNSKKNLSREFAKDFNLSGVKILWKHNVKKNKYVEESN